MSPKDKPSAPASPSPVGSAGASSSWLKSNLAAIGSAAVFSVYAAGFARTRAAAAQFDDAPLVRRGGAPRAIAAGAPVPVAEAKTSVPPTGAPSPASVSAPAFDGQSAARSSSQAEAHATAHATAHPPAYPAALDTAPDAVPAIQAVGVAAVATKAAPSTQMTATVTAAALPAPSITVAQPPAKSAASAQAASPAVAPASTPVPAAAPAPASPSAPTPTSPASPARPAAAPQPAADTVERTGGTYKDGTYSGWGTSRHGNIQATVEIKDGWIISATISQCLTEYSCSWIAALPPQVTVRQNAEVDYVTGATQSSNAFYGALVQAIAKAK